MRFTWKVSTAFSSRIYVTDAAGAAVTGLVDGGFVKQLSKDDANSAVAVVVTEIDSVTHPGHYKAVFTPNASGYWYLRVAHATYNKVGWDAEIQVGTAGTLDDLPTANGNADALLDRASAVDGSTVRTVLKLMAAAVFGSGAGTAAKPFKAIDGSAARVQSTFDPDGARGTVTVTP